MCLKPLSWHYSVQVQLPKQSLMKTEINSMLNSYCLPTVLEATPVFQIDIKSHRRCCLSSSYIWGVSAMSLNQFKRPLNLTFMLKIHAGMLTELRPLFASVSWWACFSKNLNTWVVAVRLCLKYTLLSQTLQSDTSEIYYVKLRNVLNKRSKHGVNYIIGERSVWSRMYVVSLISHHMSYFHFFSFWLPRL